MGYHVVDPRDLEPEPDRPSEMRYISEAAGMEHLGLRLYRKYSESASGLDPEGESRKLDLNMLRAVDVSSMPPARLQQS